jgi:hypothetical protein
MANLMSLRMAGYRDVDGRFAERSQELRHAMRDEARTIGRAMVSTLRAYAPRYTGEFADGFAYRTTWQGDELRLTFYVKGPHAFLLPFLTEGTRGHEIPIGGSAAQMAKGYPLHWIDKSGAHHYAWSVWHPGTLPDPFVERAVDAMSPQFEQSLSCVARRVAWLK